MSDEKIVSARVRMETATRLQELAAAQDRPVGVVIRRLIERYIRERVDRAR